MNRRNLIKAISSVAAAFVAPIGFASKAVRRILQVYPKLEFANNQYVLRILKKRHAVDESTCQFCYRLFKDHSDEEFVDCWNRRSEYILNKPDARQEMAEYQQARSESDTKVYVWATNRSREDMWYDVPPEFRQRVGEGTCKICGRKWKEHSSQEFGDCWTNGGAKPSYSDIRQTEAICRSCLRKWKEHSAQEYDDCWKKGQGVPLR